MMIPQLLDESIKNEIRLELLVLGSYAQLPLHDAQFNESYNYICSLLDKLEVRDGYGYK